MRLLFLIFVIVFAEGAAQYAPISPLQSYQLLNKTYSGAGEINPIKTFKKTSNDTLENTVILGMAEINLYDHVMHNRPMATAITMKIIDQCQKATGTKLLTSNEFNRIGRLVGVADSLPVLMMDFDRWRRVDYLDNREATERHVLLDAGRIVEIIYLITQPDPKSRFHKHQVARLLHASKKFERVYNGVKELDSSTEQRLRDKLNPLKIVLDELVFSTSKDEGPKLKDQEMHDIHFAAAKSRKSFLRSHRPKRKQVEMGAVDSLLETLPGDIVIEINSKDSIFVLYAKLKEMGYQDADYSYAFWFKGPRMQMKKLQKGDCRCVAVKQWHAIKKEDQFRITEVLECEDFR